MVDYEHDSDFEHDLEFAAGEQAKAEVEEHNRMADRPGWMAKNPYTEDRFMDRYLKGTVGYGYEEGRNDQVKALIAWWKEPCTEHEFEDWEMPVPRFCCSRCWYRLEEMEQEIERA